jgi:DNA-directed RNA polymerase subunit RPC12/RpoP
MGKSKLDNNIFDERLVGTNIKRIGNYVNNKTPIELECLIHTNYRWKIRPDKFFKCSKCPRCSGSEHYSNELLDNELKTTNIIRIGNCYNSRDSVEFQCKVDGYKWFTSPQHIKNKTSGCPKCYGNVKLSNSDIDKCLTTREIQRIGDISQTNNKGKIEWKCLICGENWLSGTNSIINRGRGCPYCKFKNERKVGNIIKSNVKFSHFKKQKIIYVENKLYRVDFYLENKCKKYIIEYNGEQHYKPVRFGGISNERSVRNFYKQIVRDNTIIKYCKDNNIEYIDIPYYFNNEDILDCLSII